MCEKPFKVFNAGCVINEDEEYSIGDAWAIRGPSSNTIPGTCHYQCFGHSETKQGAELVCGRLNAAFELGKLAKMERVLCPACRKLSDIDFSSREFGN